MVGKRFDSKVFSDRLGKAMKKRGFDTISSLANRAGVSQPAISNYLDCSRIPKLDAVVAIADSLGVSIDYLAGLSDMEQPAKSKFTPKNYRDVYEVIDDLCHGIFKCLLSLEYDPNGKYAPADDPEAVTSSPYRVQVEIHDKPMYDFFRLLYKARNMELSEPEYKDAAEYLKQSVLVKMEETSLPVYGLHIKEPDHA